MDKVLLFNSPIYREKNDVEEDYLPPLGLGYITTNMINQQINTKLIDCVEERLGKKEIFDIIKYEQPDWVGFNIFSQNMDIIKEIVENYKYEIKFIIGGQATKFIYNEIIKWNTVNKIYIIIGESELFLPHLIKKDLEEEPIINLENRKVLKISSESIYFPKDINKLLLDRQLFKNNKVINHYGQIEVPIITSRGCFYNCAFCGGARSLNKDINIRRRNKDSIIKELEDIIAKTQDVDSIRILDDLFLSGRESIKNAIEVFNDFNLSWRAMAHVLSFKKSYDLIDDLKNSGCKELFIGIESGSSKIRKLINKEGSVSQVIDTIEKILSAGIDVKGYFIYGFPDETIEDFEQTYKLAQLIKIYSEQTIGKFRTSVFQFRPYHGTQLFNKLIKNYGGIKEFIHNEALDNFDGRSQYNFQTDNYSDCTDNQINEYIIKTLNLNKEVNNE